jgi:subtilisin family serine protease
MKNTKILISSVLLAGMAALSAVPALSLAAANPQKVDVFVVFEQTPGMAEQGLVKRFGGEISYSYTLVPAIAASIPANSIQGLSRNPLVSFIEPDVEVFAFDQELDNTWGVKRIGSGTVHSSGNFGAGVKVAVIDTGIDYTHPDLAVNYKGGYDFVNKDNDPMDDNGHGTHVAGTIAAKKDGVGVVGVAPGAELYALKVLSASGSGSGSNIVAALEWAADNGMQITNNSYGSSQSSVTMETAFLNSEARGVLHVASAGNSGRCDGKGPNTVGYPARYSSVIAVAATNSSDVRPCFSSTGPEVELAAPGVAINSTKMGGGYIEYNGTSMASPHVAGAAALVISANITDKNGNGFVIDEVRQVLQSTAEDIGPEGRDTWYGFGLVSAVSAVSSLTPPTPLVSALLSTDKPKYTASVDESAILNVLVKNEFGHPISGLANTAFVLELNSTTVSDMVFTESAISGSYEAALNISTFSEGSYTLSVTVTDERNISGNSLTSFVIEPKAEEPAYPSTVSVKSISYSTEGGKNGTQHLVVTLYLEDNFGNAVSGAQVSLDLSRNSTKVASFSGTSSTAGGISFKYNNAPAGTYTSVVTSVRSSVLTWDGTTPENGFIK